MNIGEIIESGQGYNDLIADLSRNRILCKIDNVLDIGCGEGTSIFKRLGKEYWGIDINHDAIATLEQKLSIIGGTHNLIQSNFLEFDFNENTFDLVIMNNFLNEIQISAIETCVKKAVNLMNKGGYLFIRVNSTSSGEIQKAKNETDFAVLELAKNKFYIEENNYVKNFFEKEDIIKLIELNNVLLLTIKREDEQYYPENDVKSEYSFVGCKIL